MKHYEITKENNGWTSALVIRPDGQKISYNRFFSAKEAETWCYAKVRFFWGAKVADKEFTR